MEKVKMYTLSTCPWCKKTKEFFKDHDIPFEYTDFDLADDEERTRILDEMREYGANGFPFVKIGDKVIVGYKPNDYSYLMGLND